MRFVAPRLAPGVSSPFNAPYPLYNPVYRAARERTEDHPGGGAGYGDKGIEEELFHEGGINRGLIGYEPEAQVETADKSRESE